MEFDPQDPFNIIALTVGWLMFPVILIFVAALAWGSFMSALGEAVYCARRRAEKREAGHGQ